MGMVTSICAACFTVRWVAMGGQVDGGRGMIWGCSGGGGGTSICAACFFIRWVGAWVI